MDQRNASQTSTSRLAIFVGCLGTITDFNNPSEFYIQVNSLEVQSNIVKLTMKLKDYKGISEEYIPVKGEVCIAKYSLDQAIKCRIANILDTKLCNENYKNIIAPVVIEKYCSLIITDVSMDDNMPCFTVDAVLSDYGKHLHEIILENIHDWNAKEDSEKVTSAMEDNQWYRATVISFISEKIALVGYIDYGNFEMLQLNRLRPIVQKLMELPMQAMNCTLA
ncbi:hypothetical protein L345_05189, partial [Ophiophagus hannah]